MNPFQELDALAHRLAKENPAKAPKVYTVEATEVTESAAQDIIEVPFDKPGFCTLCRPPNTVPSLPGSSMCAKCDRLLKRAQRFPENESVD